MDFICTAIIPSKIYTILFTSCCMHDLACWDRLSLPNS